MSNWRPISKAPRDGTEIIALLHNGDVLCVRYTYGDWFAVYGLTPDDAIEYWIPKPDEPVKGYGT